jgi:hypothetical protein
MGEKIVSLKSSYLLLVNTHFDRLEQLRFEYLEKDWIPKFMADWIEEGRLIDIASGKVVWSGERSDFVNPEKGFERQGLLNTVNFWSIAAIEQIEEKRKELIKPLEDEKKELLVLVEEAFDQLYRGNAAITTYLNSIRKVKEVQSEFLGTFHFRDFQEEISQRLLDISIKNWKE